MTKKLSPLLFTSVLKDYIWGGRNLEKLGRKLPKDGVIAESWDIAAHKDGTSLVENGDFAGYSLTQLQDELGLDLIGKNSQWAHERGKFPLLIKLLDANRPLSVQVHPNDDYALKNEGNELGKTEMWVVLHAEPNAEVILGVKSDTTPELFAEAIQEGKLEPFLHHIPVKKGDHICVPAGSLHAIMDGLIIAEIQQNSNTTYRVYDWNRLGADGNPRPLHVDKALDVTNFAQVEPSLVEPLLISDEDGIRRSRLCENQYFITEKIEMDAGASYRGFCSGATMEIWGVLEGQIRVNDLTLNAVRFTLLPAALGEFTVKAEGKATLLRTYVGS
ncbi:MAG: mannose-6-phosphate isomerase [Chloroflexi bacterium]|nr:mannose-6-phosphate isomerase [Chloroflexota bacterium]